MSYQPANLTPFDAWLLARLRIGRSIGGEIIRASESIRPLIERMDQASEEEREGIWETYLNSLPDKEAEALIVAVVGANPDDPAPEDDGWGVPELEKPIPVESFPIDVYPEPVARLIREGSRSHGSPPDFLAASVLAVAGAAIGRSVTLSLKPGYSVTASFFIAIVGRPGTAKTPAISLADRPLMDIDLAEYKRFKEGLEEYERTLDALEQKQKEDEWVRKASRKGKGRKSDGLDDLDVGDDASEAIEDRPESIPPVRPSLRRTVVDDATIESLTLILSENSRGVLLAKDELTALMGSMNQYKGGKGSDRQFFLSVWSGKSISVDRKGNLNREPIRVPHPFLGIVGGLQDDMLGELAEAKDRDDGFIDRFLFACPDPAPRKQWSEEGVPEETTAGWAEIVQVLWRRPLIQTENGDRPYLLHFSPGAKAVWTAWFNSHQAEQEADDFPDWLRGPWAKMEQYAGRFCIALHMLRWAADPFRPEVAIPDIEPQTVRDAIRLIDYFKSHLRRAHAAMRGKRKACDDGEFIRTILNWIRRNGMESFSERDLTRNFSRISENPQALQAALSRLVARRCLRLREAAPRTPGRPGRSPSPKYDVNPRLLSWDADGPSVARRSPPDSVNNDNSADHQGTQDWKEGDDEPIPF